MDTRRTTLCVLLMLCTELCCLVQTRSLTASFTPNPAIKGSNQHTVRCDFSLDQGDNFQALNLYLESEAPANLVAIVLPDGTVTWGGSNVPGNMKQRGYLQGSKTEGHLSLVLNDTVCSDNSRVYLCALDVFNAETGLWKPRETVAVQVEAAPLAPSAMDTPPNSENATEFSELEFQCSGNVGRPAGTFQWFTFVGSSGQEVTEKAVEGSPVLSGDGCTFTRTSRLKLNLTRTNGNQRLVVRCRVNQTHGNRDVSACTDPDTDFCRMSPQINIQYPVTVRVDRETTSSYEGADVRLLCITEANPPPFLVQWQKEGENVTREGTMLTLTNLTQADQGTYVCTAFNTIAGVTANDSATASLTVDKTTTPPPTTSTKPPPPTSTTPKDGDKAATAGTDETTIIIVVVVVVVVVLVVVIVVVVFIIRRRKKGKGVEEPPEKPFNHSAINTVATRPDLVNSSYNNEMPPPYKGEDGLDYAELQFDNKPRSRRPLALDDSHTDYSDVSMPRV
ncbi:uncharacterized protein LOC143277537 isoform X2 [Babylonia areolata]|uniref:uncharacterized protein LOC143277537 isoform X2 n=1 Tax=Babylonia areolata TaxID=304850 RepID=UPI003FD0FFE8